MSYNAHKIDVTCVENYISKREIFNSIFYATKVKIMDSVEIKNWNTFSNELFRQEWKEYQNQHKSDLVDLDLLSSVIYFMTIIKLKENNEKEVNFLLDEIGLFFLRIHIYQILIKLIFGQKSDVIKKKDLVHAISEESMRKTISQYRKEVKSYAYKFVINIVLSRYILFGEFSSIASKFNASPEVLRDPQNFDNFVELLGGKTLIDWIDSPSTIFKCSNRTGLGELPSSQIFACFMFCLTPIDPKEELIQIPPRLQLLGANIKFSFIGLREDFSDMERYYYKQRCKTCNKQKKKNALCLLCGAVLCISKTCCRVNDEGELTHHAKLCGSKIGLFLYFKENQLILIYNKHAITFNSLYINQHGLSIIPSEEKDFENVYLDHNAVSELMVKYFSDKISQTILYQLNVNEAFFDLPV